jgi:uncharacterized protein
LLEVERHSTDIARWRHTCAAFVGESFRIMADRFETRFGAPSPATGYGREAAGYDAGLRKHMLTVYNYMASAVLLTGIVAMVFAMGGRNSLAFQLFGHGNPLGWVVILAPLVVGLVLQLGINRLSTTTAQVLFWTYAGLLGASLSTVLLVYTTASVAIAFFAAAAAFASLSLYGYTTKRDLSAFGTFLLMGMVGLFVAMLINLFVGSSTLSIVISFLGVLIFAGLTAYDTQKVKSVYYVVGGGGTYLAKAQIMGALMLYIDFINMFLFLLRLMGDRR